MPSARHLLALATLTKTAQVKSVEDLTPEDEEEAIRRDKRPRIGKIFSTLKGSHRAQLLRPPS